MDYRDEDRLIEFVERMTRKVRADESEPKDDDRKAWEHTYNSGILECLLYLCDAFGLSYDGIVAEMDRDEEEN